MGLGVFPHPVLAIHVNLSCMTNYTPANFMFMFWIPSDLFCKLRIILVHINLNDNEMFNMISWIDALFIQQPQQPSSVDLDYNLSLYLLIYDLYNQINFI